MKPLSILAFLAHGMHSRKRLVCCLLVTTLALFSTPAFSAQNGAQADSPAWMLPDDTPSKLAQDALEHGNAIRGALIFPQASLACSTCHIAGVADQIGPDLNQIAKDRSNEDLVQSILDPSKEITKGFQTTTVVLQSGQSHRGRLISNQDGKVVLREDIGNRNRLSIDRDEIEEIVASKKSLMPDGLTNELKSRQQFLDLMRYVIQLRDVSGQGVRATTPAQELEPHLQGLVLLDQFQCGNCHANDLSATPTNFPSHAAPKLKWIGGRLQPSYIEQFLREPSKAKPGTHMPNVLASLPVEKRDAIAQQLTHFLVSQASSKYEAAGIDEAAANRGKQLFHTVGCVACHSPRSEDGSELLEDSVSLGALRYSLAGLTDFLEDPHASRPSGRMPNMKLTHWEAVDLANYLLALSQSTEKSSDAASSDTADSKFKLDAKLADEGKKQFSQLECNACHGTNTDMRDSIRKKNPTLREVATDQGCLSLEKGDWPTFALTDSQRNLLRNTLGHLRTDTKLTDEEHVRLSMATFRCNQCHQRGDYGGATDERNDFFQTTNPNLGPQGRIPPTLTGVGAKLNRKWMREVLVSGRSIRPYIKTRMPQYGTANVEHLIELFQDQDELPEVSLPQPEGREQLKAARMAGVELVGNQGMNCIACHTFKLQPAQTMPAVDLSEMHERLKPAWVYRFLQDPKRFHRGTVMPSFWPGGKSTRKDILEGDAHQQIAAIWEWMKEGRQARTPRGLIREPMELLATNEAVMLRRKYPGIGKRGIGVGYPSQINIAFDAQQVRIATLWPDKFVDPAGVWLSQGHGTARPLSREQVAFLPGPEVDDRQQPWIPTEEKVKGQGTGRPPQHQFKGYALDQLRRPTFEYRFEGVQIKDALIDSATEGGSKLRRTISLSSTQPRPGLAFRIRPKDAFEEVSANTIKIGKRLLLKFDDAHEAQIVTEADRQIILVDIDLQANQTQQIILEYQWQR